MQIPDRPIKKAIANPSAALEFIRNQIWNNIRVEPYFKFRAINQWFHNQFYEAGDLDVMAESWDVLLILDACRVDFFKYLNTIDGDLESRRSPGSMSQEFIQATFVDRTFHDTVYVTANPFVGEIPEGTFHDVITFADEFWDSDLSTVPPKKMAKATRKALSDYPNKRIIAHFMQPHEPFLTDFGQIVTDRLFWPARYSQYLPDRNSAADVQQAYRENIEHVLEVIEDLVKDINNNIVITSDHGELMGERQFPIPIHGWEHPKSIYMDELLEVPWLQISGDSRQVISDPPTSSTVVDSEIVQQRLEDLGYQ